MSPKKCQQRVRSEKGFTLLELIVVCALIGIMLSLSIPSLRTAVFTDPLKSTARNLIGLVNGVRELAVRHRQPYLLYINESERRIWYEKEESKKEESIKVEEIENPRKNEYRLPEKINISGVWTGEGEKSQDQTEIWISKQGYMQRTRIRIEDEDRNHLILQFFPFLDSATVADSP